jgi:GT2 family glycosyltransferase
MNPRAESIPAEGLLRGLREIGDSLTGGGLRALAQRLFERWRRAGDRLTGGGLQNLFKRLMAALLRFAIKRLFVPDVTKAASAAAGLSDEKIDLARQEGQVKGAGAPLPEPGAGAQDPGAVYQRWVKEYDTIGELERSMIRAHIEGFPFCPLISVIVPLGRNAEVAFYQSINFVIAQLYPCWELCTAIDEATEPLLSKVRGDLEDGRIKAIKLNDAQDTTAAINAALSLASGEFVTVLQPGDILPEHALYELAFEIGQGKQPDIIYTDSDEISSDGKRSCPWFKPGWDPDLLLAQDYISGLALYRRTLLGKIGGLRSGFEGAEFHDLALRATALTSRVRHIPAILCHRRHENKTILSGDGLPVLRAITATHRAVRDHLDSRGDRGVTLKSAPLMLSAIRVIWPVPAPEPLVSVIIPTRDRPELTSQCVEGVLHRTEYSNLELVIIDNESVEPETFALLEGLTKSDSRVRILRHPGPFNYSTMNNAAAREAKGAVLVLLNNDVDVIESGWIRELVSQAIRPDVGLVGAKLLYPNELVQHAGLVLGPEGNATHLCCRANRNDPGYFGQLALSRSLSVVTGACVAIRRAVFLEVGGFDEANLPVSFNDVDLCLRLGRQGYRVVWTPFAELFHLESASRGLDFGDPAKLERSLREAEYMRKTWGALMKSADPFHNPNVLFGWNRFEVPSTPRRQKPWYGAFQPQGFHPTFLNHILPPVLFRNPGSLAPKSSGKE